MKTFTALAVGLCLPAVLLCLLAVDEWRRLRRVFRAARSFVAYYGSDFREVDPAAPVGLRFYDELSGSILAYHVKRADAPPEATDV